MAALIRKTFFHCSIVFCKKGASVNCFQLYITTWTYHFRSVVCHQHGCSKSSSSANEIHQTVEGGHKIRSEILGIDEIRDGGCSVDAQTCHD